MKISKYIEKHYKLLTNKVVVITGTTSGIGYETEKNLVRLGATIVCGVKNYTLAEENKKKFLLEFPEAKITNIFLDLTDEISISEFADSVKKMFPTGIFALINNAGIFARKKEFLLCKLEQHFFVNAVAPVILTKKLLTLLEKTEQSKLIFVSSISIKNKKIDLFDPDRKNENNTIKIYANAKLWLTLYAMQLKKILKDSKSNVNVNIVNPGITSTSLMDPKNGRISSATFKFCSAGMKLIFPKKQNACLSEVSALFENTRIGEWISPRIFEIWGKPCHQIMKFSNKMKDLAPRSYIILNDIIKNVEN